ncbi:MAG TPA: hypothetical protein VHJ20_13295 [Polyangia bacterium]|nr:hypothetical protein [Polyangia bacterium]
MRARHFFVLAFAALSVLGVVQWTASAATNFEVTNNGFAAYTINAVDNPTLTLTRGQTYTFHLAAGGHPFWLVTALGAGDVAANAFPTGVTNNGAGPGTLTFVVPTTGASSLFYQCGFHDPMHGTINLVAAVAIVPSIGPFALSALAGLLLIAGLVVSRRRLRA